MKWTVNYLSKFSLEKYSFSSTGKDFFEEVFKDLEVVTKNLYKNPMVLPKMLILHYEYPWL